MTARGPMTTREPMETNAPTCADASMRTSAATAAEGCTPAGTGMRGYKTSAIQAKVAWGLAATSEATGHAAADPASSTTTAARVEASCARWRGLARKVTAFGCASESGATL